MSLLSYTGSIPNLSEGGRESAQVPCDERRVKRSKEGKPLNYPQQYSACPTLPI